MKIKIKKNVGRNQTCVLKAKKDYINLAVLSGIYILIILILIIPNKVYGSQLDWENQHWVLPEYFRNRFYETGQLFPSFAAELGGGQNIYYFAYYGLYSPFLLLSYLLPFIDMRAYIIGINIIAVFAGMWLFYIWVRMKYSHKVTFFITLLFLTGAPVIFHSHRHIMFVDYIPFLIMLLISIKSYMEGKGKLWHITVISFLLVTTSFYFSVGSFMVSGIYAIMLYIEKADGKAVREHIRAAVYAVMPVVAAVAAAVLMAGILLVPTLLALMGGRQETSGGFDVSMLVPSLKGEFLLYGPYSMGLTAISVYGAIWTFFDKRKGSGANRFFAVILGVLGICPIFVYLLNGGLYLDGKVLIPFLMPALYATAPFVEALFTLGSRGGDKENLKNEESSLKKTVVIGTAICIILFIIGLDKYERLAHIAEVIPLFICLCIYMKNKKPKTVLMPFGAIAVLVCIILNCTDSLVERDENRSNDRSSAKEMADNIIEQEESVYRFTSNWGRWANPNMVLTKGYRQVSVYSSSVNTNFKDFYLNEMYNDITYRNNAILSTSYNSLYNIYMGVKYYISKEGFVPIGYERLCEKNNISVYVNETAYPIGYATSNAVSKELYDSLTFPYNIESLLKYKVPDENALFASACNKNEDISLSVEKANVSYNVINVNEEEVKETDNGYRVAIKETEKARKLTLELNNPVEGKIIFVRFKVDNSLEGAKSLDVSITLNGIKNKLTAADWKYHNGNYMFEYVLDGTGYTDSINAVLSPGYYEISNIECYTLDYDCLKESREALDEFYISKEKTKGDIIEGSIDVKNDGWFHISLPYDKGFCIYVDGIRTDYFTSDKDFVGFAIGKGHHDILIKYTAPGYNIGMLLSITGVLLLLAEIIVCRIKSMKTDKYKSR